MFKKVVLFFVVVFCLGAVAQAQSTVDSAAVNSLPPLTEKELAKIKKKEKDSTWMATHIPQRATRRSAMIPGWGQAYNREYWKIPLVYGVLAIPAITYFYNTSFYNKTKFAYEARFKEQNGDSSDVAAIDPELTGLSIGSLQNYRNSFRRDRDYSILWFILAWGLQVVDATVFGHLRHFDVSNNLSMQIHPQFNPHSKTPALTLSFNIKEKSKKPLLIAR
ncbi:MAG TPA: DUF5683 domain-containing protein [Sediminibacterium sp.]|jgi:hypothetical protein|uniref:DUF5683 domain-containing protein n=1 Tax=Sediminibacterium sp. TaxID=1917865 RepID=UPI001B52CF76|nr:DUF5683 domain-containing protein [Sediminibacterium sp.]MBP7346131.1 hypothetical protein [Sediminibacterium sp.]HPH37388.1 DUF5683 domain-containing protein [Sediminibacterium sp.]